MKIPRRILINGTLIALNFNTGIIKILTNEGPINCLLHDNLTYDEITPFFGRKLTIDCTLIHKPNNKYTLTITKIAQPTTEDEVFSRKPNTQTPKQQALKALENPNYKNNIEQLIKQTPDNETYKEINSYYKLRQIKT